MGLVGEALYDGQLLGLLLDLQHAVEAGIASHGDVGQTNLGQKRLAQLVLHIEVGEAFQHSSILVSVPAEEHLVFAEDARHAIDRHVAMLQDMQVVVPELVLDEESHLRAYGTKKTARIANGVEWQIADNISTLVVLAHLIA